VKQEQTSIYSPISTILRNSSDTQCFINLVQYSIREGTWKFCAIGTIYHHFEESKWKILLRSYSTRKILRKIGIKNPHTMSCEICGARCSYLGLVIHINDRHKKSYGEIADYLDRAKPYDSSKSLYRKLIDTIKY